MTNDKEEFNSRHDERFTGFLNRSRLKFLITGLHPVFIIIVVNRFVVYLLTEQMM